VSGRSIFVFVVAFVTATCGADASHEEAMPRVSVPPAAIHQPPRAVLPVLGGECCAIRGNCRGASVVARVEADGHVSRIRVEGSSDSAFLACVERGIRATRFIPAMIFDETVVAADWTYDLAEVRDSHVPGQRAPTPEKGGSPQ
jgi:hypothetical protein